jgi:hypothetical protein
MPSSALSVVTGVRARELASGKHLYLGERPETAERLLLPELEAVDGGWRWLVARPHPWRRQLRVKGRKLLASQVWSDMRANQLAREQVSLDWGLPPHAVDEIARYCEDNAALTAIEADEERRRNRACACSSMRTPMRGACSTFCGCGATTC